MKNGVFSEFKIFAGNSNTELAEEIAAIMGQPLGKSTVSKISKPVGNSKRRGRLHNPVNMRSCKR